MSFVDKFKKKVTDVTNKYKNVFNDAMLGIVEATPGVVSTISNLMNGAGENSKSDMQTSNPYNQKYTDMLGVFESGMNDYINGTEEIGELKKQAAKYEADMQTYINQYINRDKFSYDINTDAMYAMYRDQYEKNANLARESAAAQAAGLTGGYGSTYASAMGNMAYSSEMDKLNDKAGELYDKAYNQYLQDGQDLLDAASLYGSLADSINQKITNAQTDSLNKASAAGEYANYLYSYTDEAKERAAAEEEKAAAEEEQADIKEASNELATLFDKGAEISSSKYKMQGNGSKSGYLGIANAIDLERDFLANLDKYRDKEGELNYKNMVDELYRRLSTVTIGGVAMTDAQKSAYVDWVLAAYKSELGG